jgi:hypothetical protein
MLIVTINLKCSILLSLICKEISYENSNQCKMHDQIWTPQIKRGFHTKKNLH